MNREFVSTPADITKLASSIINADSSGASGRATYLRSLLAATQTELAGKPILRIQGRPKRPDMDLAAQTFDKVAESFYTAVLAAVPENLTAAERQSKTSFARSAAATLRRAIRTGWNPLGEAVPSVAKGRLTAWIVEHAAPRTVTPKVAESRLTGYVTSITELLERLPKEDGDRLRAAVLTELGAPTQHLTNVSLRRTAERPAAH